MFTLVYPKLEFPFTSKFRAVGADLALCFALCFALCCTLCFPLCFRVPFLLPPAKDAPLLCALSLDEAWGLAMFFEAFESAYLGLTCRLPDGCTRWMLWSCTASCVRWP